jgi:imidazolonepropionase-like amidohydrolase
MDSGFVTAVAPDLTRLLAGHGRSPVWLRVGALFDGHELRRDGHLVFDGARLLHVGGPPTAAGLPLRSSHPDLHLPDHLALPGLIEAHAHLFLEGGECEPARRATFSELGDAELLARAGPRLERLLRCGVIAVRDAGDRNGVGLALQRRDRSPERGLMPYVDSPGAALYHQGRYGAFMGRPVEEHGGIEAAVAARVAEGVHRIKLLATGIINFEKGAVTTRPQMPNPELAVAVAASRLLGRQTMVHCSGNDGVAACIEAGVDSLEHGFFVDRDQLAQLRDRDIAWVPTFAPVQFQWEHPEFARWSPAVRDHLRRILDGHAASLAAAAALGVRLVAGSDAGSHGVPHGHGLLRELELMEAAGCSALAVLRSATGASASRLGFADDFGRLRSGALPRFLLADPRVTESIRFLRSPAVLVFDGTVLATGDDPAVPGM